jgi:SAM-dependent methyltransferase
LRAWAESQPGRTFGRVAETYRRTRPRYSRAVVDRAASELGLGPGSTVLDLAAGTGNLTRTLSDVFATVLAVEPDAEMRAQFDGEVLDGTAESIPLPDGAVDAVFVGEAFHWFDFEPALAEIERVSRALAVVAREWEWTELVPATFKDDLDKVWARFHGPNRSFPDWRDVVRPDGEARFVDTVPISGPHLVDLMLTGSTPASIPDSEREAIARRAYPLMDDEYGLQLVTDLYWKRL